MLTVRRFLAAIAVLAAMTSCGSGSEVASADAIAATAGDDVDSTPSAGDDASGSDTASTGTTSTDAASGEPKTLDEYLGGAANFARGGQGGGGGAAGNEDQRLEEQRQIEQAVQVCMKAQGFEYTPTEVGTGIQFVLADQRAGISAEEYAQTEGFGISTRFDAVLEGEIDLDTDATPNETYVASLSDGEADAYELALRGAPAVRNDEGQAIDPDTGEVLQGGRGGARTGGCRTSAQTEVRGDFSALADLADDFADLADRIASDPQIVEFNTNWVSCMQESGFTFDDEGDARQEIQQAFQPLLRSFFASADDDQEPAPGEQGQGGQGGRGNRLEAVAGLTLTAEQEAELSQLQDRERTLATTSLTCQADTAERIAEITARYEADFVAQNRDVLDSLGG